MTRTVSAFAPGRVNIIGEHTDYTGGLVLPMAIQFGTTVTVEPGGSRIVLRSGGFPGVADIALGVTDPAATEPDWARYIAGVVATIRPQIGCTGYIETTLPVGAGLSSSAALEVSVALALGFTGEPIALAEACREAEETGAGVPCGIMDQLASVAGQAGYALRIDCSRREFATVEVPHDWELVVVPSGQIRTLAGGSGYARRRAECDRVQSLIGPLHQARLESLGEIPDPVLRRRARHVVTENRRVDDMLTAMAYSDSRSAGQLLLESHASLRDDFDVSTPLIDGLVDRLVAQPSVHGARILGGGFGGSVLALAEPGALDVHALGGWVVRASSGASVSQE